MRCETQMSSLLLGQSSATAFPAPLRGRDREGGGRNTPSTKLTLREASAEASELKQTQWVLYPPPCPSPAGGEGTVEHASSQLTQ